MTYNYGLHWSEAKGYAKLIIKDVVVDGRTFGNRKLRKRLFKTWTKNHNLDNRKDWYIDIQLEIN